MDIDVFNKITSIDCNLENIRDAMIGLDEPLGPYILDENGNVDKDKIYKLTDTFMLYVMNQNPLYNKNELMFFRYCFLSMFFMAGCRECYDDDNIIFKMILSFLDIMMSDIRIYAELAVTNYNSLKPTFISLENAVLSEDGTILLNEGENEVKISELSNFDASLVEQSWIENHPNSLLADEILKINQKLLDYSLHRPYDFVEVIEYSLYSFLNAEGKGFYSEEYFEKILDILFEKFEEKEKQCQ